MLRNLSPCEYEEIYKSTPMKDFYRDKIIFLTGSTGVLGELFVEKLLRCNVKRLYLLLRNKKGLSETERLKEIFTTAVFDRLAAIDPDYFNRIRVIKGDVGKLKLGISDEDCHELCENVEITLHVAANVRFECALETMCLTNIRGTREVLRLVRQFQHISMFVYISTAYCRSTYQNFNTKEEFYPAPIDPDVFIRISEYFDALPDGHADRELLATITKKFMSPWPNTYSFSKAVTEEMIRRAGADFPIAVIRPSIVIATCLDPLPGYCTNYFGLNGVLGVAGAGLSRIIYGNTSNRSNVVCADFVINSTLAVIWDSLSNAEARLCSIPRIYAINSFQENLTWGHVDSTMSEAYRNYPWNSIAWYPKTNYSNGTIMQCYLTIMYQMIPGILFDTIFKIFGSDKRVLPFYRKITTFMLLIKFFMSNQWHFDTDNIKDVYSRMDVRDREYFPTGIEGFEMKNFAKSYALGIRTYMVKEPINNLVEAKKKFFKFKILHTFVLVCYYLLMIVFFYFLFRISGVCLYVQNLL